MSIECYIYVTTLLIILLYYVKYDIPSEPSHQMGGIMELGWQATPPNHFNSLSYDFLSFITLNETIDD